MIDEIAGDFLHHQPFVFLAAYFHLLQVTDRFRHPQFTVAFGHHRGAAIHRRASGVWHIVSNVSSHTTDQLTLYQANNNLRRRDRTDGENTAVHFDPSRQSQHAGLLRNRGKHVSGGTVAADKDQQIDAAGTQYLNGLARIRRCRVWVGCAKHLAR